MMCLNYIIKSSNIYIVIIRVIILTLLKNQGPKQRDIKEVIRDFLKQNSIKKKGGTQFNDDFM